MERILNIGNYSFNYCSAGNHTNFPIIFLHGFLGNCHDFDEVILHFSSDFYCLAIDISGHGKTQVLGRENHYSMKNTAQGLIKFLDALSITQCILMGYSMGGRLALYLALHFPEYFYKVVLESASPGLKTDDERRKRIQHDLKLAKKLETEDFPSFLSHWYDQPLLRSIKEHPNFERMLERRCQGDPWELSKSLRGLSTGAQLSLWDKLPQTSLPFLFLVGELDKKFVTINHEMASLCQPAHLEIASSCGHNVHFENVGLFVEVVRQFFSSP